MPSQRFSAGPEMPELTVAWDAAMTSAVAHVGGRRVGTLSDLHPGRTAELSTELGDRRRLHLHFAPLADGPHITATLDGEALAPGEITMLDPAAAVRSVDIAVLTCFGLAAFNAILASYALTAGDGVTPMFLVSVAATASFAALGWFAKRDAATALRIAASLCVATGVLLAMATASRSAWGAAIMTALVCAVLGVLWRGRQAALGRPVMPW